MNPFGFEKLTSVLCLGAHADDIEIGCGAAILELIQKSPSVSVDWHVFSSSEVRSIEAKKSANLFLDGLPSDQVSIRIHKYSDALFPVQMEPLKNTMSEIASGLDPDLIFTHRLEDRHQDHRTLAELTWQAFRNHTILEYEIPKYEGDLGQPSCYFPVTKMACETKIKTLLRCFPSQAAKPWFDQQTFWAMLRLRGLECHSESRFAEAFTARKITVK